MRKTTEFQCCHLKIRSQVVLGMVRLLQALIGLHEPSDDKFDIRFVNGQLHRIFS